MRKQKETIEIKEDVKIPGTDLILEAGDKIQILTERTVRAEFKPVESKTSGSTSVELSLDVEAGRSPVFSG